MLQVFVYSKSGLGEGQLRLSKYFSFMDEDEIQDKVDRHTLTAMTQGQKYDSDELLAAGLVCEF